MVFFKADFAERSELLKFPVGACQQWIVLPSHQAIAPAPSLCVPLSVELLVQILRFVGPFSTVVFLATSSRSDGKSLFGVEAKSVSVGDDNSQVELWVCAVSEGPVVKLS